MAEDTKSGQVSFIPSTTIARSGNPARMARVTGTDPQGSRYRDPEYLLGVPRALGPSHGRNPDELYREAARPGRFTRAVGTRGSFALNGNHAMYGRGKAYFQHLLPTLGVGGAGQRASFFCLRNDYWLLLGLDTGYYSVGLPVLERIFTPSCKLHDKLVKWLREDVKLQDDRTRGVILFSHHQYHSQFEAIIDTAAQQFSQFVHRPVLWLWGHEHRFAIYRKHATQRGKLEAYGRCIGHGGLPIEDIDQEPKADAKHQVGLVLYDRRTRAEIGPRRTKVGWNGFALLEFQGRSLTVEHRDARNRLLVRERWEVGAEGTLRGVAIEKGTDDPDLKLHGANLEDALR